MSQHRRSYLISQLKRLGVYDKSMRHEREHVLETIRDQATEATRKAKAEGRE